MHTNCPSTYRKVGSSSPGRLVSAVLRISPVLPQSAAAFPGVHAAGRRSSGLLTDLGSARLHDWGAISATRRGHADCVPRLGCGRELLDAACNGGLVSNPSQALNFVVSAITTLGVAIALTYSMNAVLVVFGAWATLSGAAQLATGVRRWRSYGAQWAMALSGGQSALAGVFFIHVASGAKVPSIADVAGYAAVGAFYFLVAAIWLTIKDARRGNEGAIG